MSDNGAQRYVVQVSREDGFWVAVVLDVAGAATETRRLAHLEVEVRDLLSGLLDVDDDAFDLEFQFAPALASAAAEALRAYRSSRERLAAVQSVYERDQARVVQQLRADSVTLRDVAYLTGMSHQRVQQLEHTHTRASRATVEQSPATPEQLRIRQILTDAEFTDAELREFAGQLEFAAVLAEGGLEGTVASVRLSDAKVRALGEVAQLIAGSQSDRHSPVQAVTGRSA